MNWRLVLAAALAHLALSGAASAAVLANLQGDVQYSRPGSTSGFLQASSGLELKPGDLVMAGSGRAVLVYSDDCSVEIRPNTSVDVQSAPPCTPVVTGQTSSPSLSTIAVGTAAVGLAVGVAAYFVFRSEAASQE